MRLRATLAIELAFVIALAIAVAACSAGSREPGRGAPPPAAASSSGTAGATPREPPPPIVPEPGRGALAPSLARIVAGGSRPEAGESLADVEDCAQCHADVASQWRKSAHAFASFNNPVYRVVVDRLRHDRGAKTSQFCGGCHDVSLLVDGAMLAPIVPTDLRAHAGITCKTCHGIESTRPDGNASWDLDLSPIPVPKEGDPESVLRHRASVGRATLRTTGLCASCHKAFLDESTGNAHHLIGQDDASPWARSAFAGSDAARIDEDLPPRDCRGCHMPRTPVTQGDLGAKNGTIASHFFLGGHTWLAAMQGDADLVERGREFLAHRVSIDVAGLRGEREKHALIGSAPVALDPGEHVVIDVALRNLDVGHRFPGGVMDADGTWIEVTVDDARGQRVAEAGTAHEASGADPTAHVLASYMARENGARLDVRETHEFRAGVFNNTLLPRDAVVVGYGFVAPAEASRYPLKVSARLRHRTRNLELQRAACADSKSDRGRDFGVVGLKRVARALDACRMQPVTELARADVLLGVSAGGPMRAPPARGAETQEVAFARSFAYGLGLTHSLQERLDDARLPLGAALALARTPRERAMALGALATIASKEGRVEETFSTAAAADAAAREAGIASPVAMQRVRGEVLGSAWRLEEAAPLLVDVASRSPRDDGAWSAAALAFAGAGQSRRALDPTSHGLRLQPREGDLLRVQALALKELQADAEVRAAAEAAFLERRSPDAAPAIRGKCSATVAGCANERIPVHVHEMRRK